MDGHAVTLLGTGLIGDFYTNTLHGQRGRDRVRVVYSRSEERAAAFSQRWDIPEHTTDLKAAIEHPSTDVVIVGLPNHLHEEAVEPRGGGRQGHPVHEAARPDRGRGQADARDRREGGRVRRLPRGPVLHAEDAQGGPVGRRRVDRRRHLGPVAGDPPRTAFGLVLGRPADRWRRDHRPRLPLHRDRPQLHRQGRPAGRGPLPHRHAGPSDRRRGQRDRAHPVRVGRDGPVRGELDVPGRDGPARRGGRHPRHGLAQPFPADRLRDVHGRRRGRLRRREAESASGWLFPVGDEVSELGYMDMFSDMFRSIDAGRDAPARRSTTATWSTRSWTPAIARRRSTPGSRSSSTGAAARRPGCPRRPRRTRARSSSSARSCPTAGTSSSSRTRRRATSRTGSSRAERDRRTGRGRIAADGRGRPSRGHRAGHLYLDPTDGDT